MSDTLFRLAFDYFFLVNYKIYVFKFTYKVKNHALILAAGLMLNLPVLVPFLRKTLCTNFQSGVPCIEVLRTHITNYIF